MGKTQDDHSGGVDGNGPGNRDGGEYKPRSGKMSPGGDPKRALLAAGEGLARILGKKKNRKVGGFVPNKIGFSGGFGTTSERKSLFSRSKKFRAN